MDERSNIAFSFVNTVLNARSLFRTDVWRQVVTKMAGNSYNSYSQPREPDTFKALHKINRMMVSLSPDDFTTGFSEHPVSVVFLSVELKSHVLSQKTIAGIVDSGMMYGEINQNSQIVIQILFKGLLTGNANTNRDCTAPDEAVALVIIKNDGMASGYNIPPGPASAVVYRCVSLLLLQTTGRQPSMIVNTVMYCPRTLCDDCLYAMYVTAACVEGLKFTDFPESEQEDRMFRRHARPTRVIANLRFLMLLGGDHCKEVARELLLDEVNTLDSIRFILQDT
jgi:hypothetical protein